MNQLKKTSVLICLAILVPFLSVGVILNWSAISSWISAWEEPAFKSDAGVDPFSYDPPIPSLVKDLKPVYDIQAELYTSEAKIKGTVAIEFDNPGTEDLRFFVYDYLWNPMTITSIRYQDKSLPFQRRLAVIQLTNPLGQEKRGKVTIQFENPVPRRGTRFGVKDDIWTLTTWYPMLGAQNQRGQWYEPPKRIDFGDPFVYHYGDYHLSFISPQGYKWVSTAGVGETKPLEGNRQEVQYNGKRLLNFALVGSPLYQIETVTFAPNLTVDIASIDKRNIARIKSIAETVFPVYTEWYGPLPYQRVAIAETSTGTTYAMEYANMAIFKRDMQASTMLDHWLPHEIAHLWWYNSVATLEARYGWLDEGMVERSVAHYKQARYGTQQNDSLIAEYKRDVDRLAQRYPYGKLGKELHQFSTQEEFRWTWYSKGALLFENLRQTLGDETYKRFLQRVQRTYHGSIIGPEHLDQALGQVLQGEARYFVPNNDKPNGEGFAPISLTPYVTTIINSVSYYPQIPSRVIDQTVYLPLRDLAEKLGYRVTWSTEKAAIELSGYGQTILVKEKSSFAEKDGTQIDFGKKLLEVKGRTLAPISFFEQVLGSGVDWDEQDRIIKLRYPAQ
ncbi:stalk domain-containing protein [Brevibacillus ruminantium]|uniref:Stalk domain-containing protein n=1 Tax=Brevibacillus ruminantium TaxID=2950604 RepID=A0ABY4W9H9_9BACL|nr:stalk domain-containing protein [Brevibacillus ruminantium]USG63682.1 stalk domain-containing protein [Brevibacillus ruminantium]